MERKVKQRDRAEGVARDSEGKEKRSFSFSVLPIIKCTRAILSISAHKIFFLVENGLVASKAEAEPGH
jgi:hypothetical protein